jgi:hypothetical protein
MQKDYLRILFYKQFVLEQHLTEITADNHKLNGSDPNCQIKHSNDVENTKAEIKLLKELTDKYIYHHK